MSSITEYVNKLQELTQQNLDILSAINDSFFTKQDHLMVGVGSNRYVIPSFISLENKINSLQANFDNLVHAPESGEAFFSMDGNSRSIEVRKYTSVPNSLTLGEVTEFGIEQNNIFKDFVTPKPYIHFGLTTLPNDITSVVVKKVIPLDQTLKDLFASYLVVNEETTKVSCAHNYKDLHKVLTQYTKDLDYIEYDTKMDLPIRKNIGTGTYVIEKIVRDWVDEDLTNYITIKLRDNLESSVYSNNLKYRLFDETIETALKVGDELVTFEGNAKMQITDIQANINTITIKVLHGEFLNLVECPTGSSISNLSKIKFYSPIDFNNDKYIRVPLEEDKYVFITIAALNDRMNIQSPWGSGLVVNTFDLTTNNGTTRFETYYKDNVRNVGDILFEITSMMSNTLTKHTKEEYDEMTKLVPIIDTSNILVTQINKHLDNSESVKNIRSLYDQKSRAQTELQTTREEISRISTNLASVSFEDTTGIKTVYENQLKNLRIEENNLLTSINKIINDIALSANNSETPIENAKYRIRGYFDYNTNESLTNKDYLKSHIKGIRVQYRYKNVNQEQGTAFTINDKFVFSDWNNMACFDRARVSSYGDNYQFAIEPDTTNQNEPSFNQIDIPISQGETVDIRLKLVYDFGHPFVETTSDWSPIVNVEFPKEYLNNVQVLDIIAENEKDRESLKFTNLLHEEGITKHVDDNIKDQDITYYHKPENIASGFYTPERRIIPLRDKLMDFDTIITELRDEILGQSAEKLKVYLEHGDDEQELLPFSVNKASVDAYEEIKNVEDGSDIYDVNGGVVTSIYNLILRNESEHTLKLFSIFPGVRTTSINGNTDYQDGEKCVWMDYHDDNGQEGSMGQVHNQFMYFRMKDVYDHSNYYTDNIPASNTMDQLSSNKEYYKYATDQYQSGSFVCMYPRIREKYSLCMDSDERSAYILLNPNEELVIPIVYEYRFDTDEVTSITKTMAFDVRPSLYKDPVTYTFQITAKRTVTLTEKLLKRNRRAYKVRKGTVLNKFKPTIK